MTPARGLAFIIPETIVKPIGLLLALLFALPTQASQTPPDELAAMVQAGRYSAGDAEPMRLAIALTAPGTFGLDAATEAALETALLPSAADNQWIALLLATRAEARGDAAGVDALLAKGATAPTFESGRRVAFNRLVIATLGRAAVPAEGVADSRFIGALARSVSVAEPPPAAIARHCVAKDAPAERIATCVRFAEAWLSRGDTIIDRFTALLILEKLPAADTEALSAKQLRFHWRQSQASLLMAQLLPKNPAAVRAFYDDVVTIGEARAMDALIQRNGIALDPPAGWTPPASGAAPATP